MLEPHLTSLLIYNVYRYGNLMLAYVVAGYNFPDGAEGMEEGKGGRPGEPEPSNFHVSERLELNGLQRRRGRW